MSENTGIQLPLETYIAQQQLRLTIQDITPIEYLDSGEPSRELIQSIAEHGVPPIIVCPDTRWEQEHPHAVFYYPLDGKRRMKALQYLVDIAHYYREVHAGDLEFSAELYPDLTPNDAKGFRMAFMANNIRSDNVITNIQAIRTAEEHLGVSAFDIEGRRVIAQFLNTAPQVVGRFAKGTLLDEAILEAHAAGQLSSAALEAAMNIRDKDARIKIAKRVKDGEVLSAANVNLYNKELAQITLLEAMNEEPEIFDFAEAMADNPLAHAGELLRQFLGRKKNKENYFELYEALKIIESLL